MSRQRWAYTMGGRPLPEPVRVDEDFRGESAERQPLYTDRYMEGERAPDGSDIGSRAKRKAWMAATGSADAADYSPAWFERKQQERSRAFEVRSEDIARAMERLGNRRP